MTCGSETGEFERFLSGHGPLPVSAAFRDGELLGEWRITAFLGKGGGGEVYRAEHAKDFRIAALKVHVPRPGRSDSREKSARERFEREARILSGNTYPFFPRFYEFGESRGYPYFAIELLEPVELPHSDADVSAFLLELCNAVRVLHGHGLVHRDIKPQNVMRRSNGQLVLIDLGLVKESAPFADHTGVSATIVDGRVVGAGTPRYAAPEQFNGGAVSPATDIHALGMLANECFGGRPPSAWERIISRSTSSIPERRYADVDAFADAIRRRHCGSLKAVLLGVAFFIAVGASIYFSQSSDSVSVMSSESPELVGRPSWRDLSVDVLTNVVERHVLYEKFSTNRFGVVMMTEQAWRDVTNPVAGTVIRLDNRMHRFEEPILLETNRRYWVVGPGTLDAPVEGLPGSRVCLDNCVLINRTVKPLSQCGVRYIFGKGSYLNFIEQNRNDDFRSYIEDFDADCNALEFRGPESAAEIINSRNAESLRGLDF